MNRRGFLKLLVVLSTPLPELVPGPELNGRIVLLHGADEVFSSPVPFRLCTKLQATFHVMSPVIIDGAALYWESRMISSHDFDPPYNAGPMHLSAGCEISVDWIVSKITELKMSDECEGCGEKFDEEGGVVRSPDDDAYCIECQECMDDESVQHDMEFTDSLEANSRVTGELDFEGGDDGED